MKKSKAKAAPGTFRKVLRRVRGHWPLLVISENKKQLVTVILRVFTSVYAASGMGIVYAGYVIASIPLLILFSFASRLYMEGMTAGAVKG